MFAQPDSITLLKWRGTTVALCPPPLQAYVYLLHFDEVLGNPAKHKGTARHYCGSTGALDHRLHDHRDGRGAAIMRACQRAGITWRLARLWRFDSAEAARAYERRLKKTAHNPRRCPFCNPHQVIDPYTFMHQGHSLLLVRPVGKRQPMGEACPRFVRWTRNEVHP